MSDEASVSDLVQQVSKTGAEIFLYYGSVVAKPEARLPIALKAELARRSKEIRAFLVKKMADGRSTPGLVHRWVLRLGDMRARSDGALRPAYLACGSHDWSTRMIRQAQECSDQANKYERARWLILEQDQVGAPTRNDRGVLVASVTLPDGVALGGPPGSSAEIVSACPSCLEPQITDERVAEIVKNDD